MIEISHEIFIDELRELGVNDKIIECILSSFSGYRIYFKKTASLYRLICKRYKNLLKVTSASEAIKILSNEFNKSKSRIRIIVNKCNTKSNI